MIDFVHSNIDHGLFGSKDENYLDGLDNLISYFETIRKMFCN